MIPVINSLSSTEKKERLRGFCCKHESEDPSPYEIPTQPIRASLTDESYTHESESSINSPCIDRVFYKSSDPVYTIYGFSKPGIDTPNSRGKKRNSSVIWRPSNKLKSNWDIYFASDTELTTGWHERKTPPVEGTDWEESEILSISQTPTPIKWPSKHSFEQGLFPDVGNEVLVSFMSKLGLRYTTCPLNTRLEELAAWLNLGTNRILPICEISNQTIRSTGAPTTKFRRKTLSDVFGERLDPVKTGITFFLGPVEGKPCFKMNLCDVHKLKHAIRESDCIVLKEGHNLAEVTNDQREEISHLTLPGR